MHQRPKVDFEKEADRAGIQNSKEISNKRVLLLDLQILIGCTGFIGNCMAVPVLVSKKLNSIFNRILVFLAVFDNVYILCSVLEGKACKSHIFRMQISMAMHGFPPQLSKMWGIGTEKPLMEVWNPYT